MSAIESNYPRSSKDSTSQGSKNTVVDKRVEELFNLKRRVTQADVAKLRNTSDDPAVWDQILSVYEKKYHQLAKRARKFVNKMREKYGINQIPYNQLLEKALEYKKKYHLSDIEFEEFRRQYEIMMAGKQDSASFAPVMPVTALSKVLGNVQVTSTSNFKLSDKDAKVLQDILKLYEETKSLHAQVVLQSITYQDCSPEAVSGQFKKEFGHNLSCHIHPVVAALFLPKFDIVDRHFLQASVPYIVKARYNGEPLRFRPEYELFYNLVTDPNDVVCDTESTIKDLYHRCNLQRHLWNAVLNLRNGQYYNCSSQEFMIAIDQCRVNKYDTPDLIYGKYDGTVLKRLLAAFSFRPTVVATSPSYSYLTNVNPLLVQQVPTVTSTSMIDLRIPYTLDDSQSIHLNDARSYDQIYFENNQLVAKKQQVLYSREVLIFFVDRRSHLLKIHDIEPVHFNKLPAAIAGFERLNDTEVGFDHVLRIREESYQLRSVVCAEVNNAAPVNNLILGSSAAIHLPPNPEINYLDSDYILYDPQNATTHRLNTGEFYTNTPVQALNLAPQVNQVSDSFIEMARKRGLIFIYQIVKDDSNPYDKKEFLL
jgi:hypothetical protein